MLLLLLLHFTIVFLSALLLMTAAADLLQRHLRVPGFLLVIAASAAVCAAGYVVFWAFLAHHWLGLALAVALHAFAAVHLYRQRQHLRALCCSDGAHQVLTGFLIGTAYVSVLCLYSPPGGTDAPDFAAHRFNDLPVDNALPVIFADALEKGHPTRHLFGTEANDWLSSDRPPLQTGVILLLRPGLRLLNMKAGYLGFSASLWFQLLWVPALWAVLRGVGASQRQSLTVIAVCACTGFCILYSLYTWPKFGAAALVLGGMSILFSELPPSTRWNCSAAMFGLAHLSHGGSDFALIPLCLLIFVPRYRPSVRNIMVAAAVFFICIAPWVAYQKFYDPPGNRLLKMHLAGVLDVDSRGFTETLRDEYRKAGLHRTLEAKRANLSRQIEGSFSQVIQFRTNREAARTRRDEEFFHFFRAMCFGGIAVMLVPVTLGVLARRPAARLGSVATCALYLSWAAATVLIWCALMFAPGSAVIHQGSLAPLLVAFAIPWLLLLHVNGRFFAVLFALQIGSFATTWLPANPGVQTGLDPVALGFLTLAAAALAAAGWWLVPAADAQQAN